MAKYPLQVTIRDIPQSNTVEAKIHKKAEKLFERYLEQITSMKVVAEYEKRHQKHGKLYKVTIDMNIPGTTLVDSKHDENLYIAIREAFRSLTRQMDEQMSIRHGSVKSHADIIQGKVARMFDDGDFGFIEDGSGNEFYFNANNVAYPSFAKLKVGSQVHFIVHLAKSGAQAHRVSTGRH